MKWNCDGESPSESEEVVLETYNGFQACFFALFWNLAMCSELDCKFCRSIVEIQDGEEMK